MTLLRLTLRGLAAHWVRLLMTTLSVVLGVSFVAGTFVLTATMDRAFAELNDGFDADIDAVVRTEGTFSQGFADYGDTTASLPAELADDLRGEPEVVRVYPMALGLAAVLDAEGEEIGAQGAPQYVMSWYERPGSGYELDGRAPEGDSELVLDEATAEQGGYAVGDTVLLRVDGDEHELELTGVFTVAGATGLAGATLVGLEHAAAQELVLGDTDAVSEFYLVGQEGKSQWQVADSVAPLLDLGQESLPMDIVRDEASAGFDEALGFLNTFLLVFAGIALFVGSFLIFNTFAMLLAQRGRELALLRAIGASQQQVRAAVLGEALVVGVAASAGGLAGGLALARGLLGAIRSFGVEVPETTLALGPLAVAASFTVGIGVTLVSAYGPVRRGAKVPPIAALRDDVALPTRSLWVRGLLGAALLGAGVAMIWRGLEGAGSDLAPWLVGFGAATVFTAVAMLAPLVSRPVVAVLGAPFPLLFRVSGRLGRANAMRNPRRTAATASALMIGLGLVATVGTLNASTAESMDRWIDDELGFDYIATPEDFTSYVPDGAVEDLAAVEGMEAVVAPRFGVAEVDGEPVPVGAAESAHLTEELEVVFSEGEEPAGEDAFAASAETAAERGWSLGQSLEWHLPNGTEAELRLVGIYDESSDMFGFPALIGMDGYAEHFDEVLVNSVFMRAEGEPGAGVRSEVDAAVEGHSGVTVMDRTELKDFYGEQLGAFTNLIYVMLLLSILIAALGIINTLALATAERVREIGLLRAVGLSRLQLRRMVRLESVVISVFGALLGTGIGIVFAWALQRVLEDEGITVLAVPAGQLAGLLGVAVVIGVLAALWPAWRASRMDVLRAIATE